MGQPSPEQLELKTEEKILEITWDDGHVSSYPLRYLRGWCSCAACQGHFARRLNFVENAGPDILEAEPVGGYGVRFQWADGHGSGIYDFPRLRAICPCEACGGLERASDPAAGRAFR